MCKYLKLETATCDITKEHCPFTYFCNRTMKYVFSNSDSCKVIKNMAIPKGFYEVKFQRHDNLYVEIDGFIEIIENSLDFVPGYVKLNKTKAGKWRIKDSI